MRLVTCLFAFYGQIKNRHHLPASSAAFGQIPKTIILPSSISLGFTGTSRKFLFCPSYEGSFHGQIRQKRHFKPCFSSWVFVGKRNPCPFAQNNGLFFELRQISKIAILPVIEGVLSFGQIPKNYHFATIFIGWHLAVLIRQNRPFARNHAPAR